METAPSLTAFQRQARVAGMILDALHDRADVAERVGDGACLANVDGAAKAGRHTPDVNHSLAHLFTETPRLDHLDRFVRIVGAAVVERVVDGVVARNDLHVWYAA